MKRQLISSAVAAGTVLAATSDVQALPPRQHSVNGVIETIECASRTVTLKSKDGAAPLTFVWNDSYALLAQGRLRPVQFYFWPDGACLVSARGRPECAPRSEHKTHACCLCAVCK
jgi:hypothetical protein